MYNECRLCGTEIEHSASLSVAIAALMHDEEVRLDSKVESLREEEEVFVLAYFVIEIRVQKHLIIISYNKILYR